jgi:hypothetical protein
MRTTIELPDELYRQAKSQAALRGRKLKDLVAEGLRRVIEAPELPDTPAQSGPSLLDLMRDCCGIATDVPADYATNPKYMEDFGR